MPTTEASNSRPTVSDSWSRSFVRRTWVQCSLLIAFLICLIVCGADSLAQSNAVDRSATTQQSSGPSRVCSRSCRACTCNTTADSNATAFVVQQPQKSETDQSSRLKDLVPLLQSLVWAVLIGTILIMWRREITKILQDGRVRIKAGEVEIEVLPPEQVTSIQDLPEPIEIIVA